MVFSGDNKTEKGARSAQVALVDNGSMTDTLGFIEGMAFNTRFDNYSSPSSGRHEMFHFMFLMVDICLDIFADDNNLEEATIFLD